MDFFWTVTLFQVQVSTKGNLDELKVIALNDFEGIGIEEYNLQESEVDELLGERSYSGGDLPSEIIDEVEEKIRSRNKSFRIFFINEEKALAFLKLASSSFLCEAQIDKFQSEDWNSEWKKHYSPILINSSFEVLPAWYEKTKASSKAQILINPGMGFGTGSHATTFLCLKFLTEKIDLSNLNYILDFGSGSGILGLSALLLNNRTKVDFYDIDPEANENCYQNAEINELANLNFRLLLPDYRNLLLPKYDLIFANILENILIDECHFLVNKMSPGSFLILSGLLKHQLQTIIDLYQSSGLNFMSSETKGDWGALLFRK